MIGALLFLATIPYFPHGSFILISVFSVLFRRKIVMKAIANNKRFVIGLLVFELACLINFVLHAVVNANFEMPYFWGIPAIFLIAMSLQRCDLKAILYLLCIEVAIGVFEYMSGVYSILPNYHPGVEFGLDESLSYYKRVAGLSVGSSSFAVKLLIGIIFAGILKDDLKSKYLWILLWLSLGLFVTFNRTVIISVVIYFVIVFLFFIKQFASVKVRWLILCVFFVCGIWGFSFIQETFINQFTRNTGTIDLSGRPLIWSQFMLFIDQHPLFGNGSFRLLVPYYSGMIHAHNSYIQIIANNGIIIGVFFISIVLLKINRSNWLYITPLLLYSMTQYGIFWGMSFVDVCFFAFLCNCDQLSRQRDAISIKRVSKMI